MRGVREWIYIGGLATGHGQRQDSENRFKAGAIAPRLTVKRCKTGMRKRTTLQKSETFLGRFTTSVLRILLGHTGERACNLKGKFRLAAGNRPLHHARQ